MTGDKDFVRVLYAANANSTDGLPYDLFAEDPAGFQQRVAKFIADEGPDIQTGQREQAQLVPGHAALRRQEPTPGQRGSTTIPAVATAMPMR